MALQFGNTKIGGMQYNGVTIGEAMYNGQIVYRSVIRVTPQAPTFHNADPWYTLPTQAGVTYTVSGTPAPGETVTVTATALDGYELDGTASWTHRWALTIGVQKTGNQTVYGLTRTPLTGWIGHPAHPGADVRTNGIYVPAGTYYIEAQVTLATSGRSSIDFVMDTIGDRIPGNGLVAVGTSPLLTSGTVTLPAGVLTLRANAASGSAASETVQASGTWFTVTG